MKTLLNYQLQNEVSKANFNTVKRIYNRPPFMKVVYLDFHRKRLEPRVLPWQQYSRCHFVSFVMYISGVKFEYHYSRNARGHDRVKSCLTELRLKLEIFLI